MNRKIYSLTATSIMLTCFHRMTTFCVRTLISFKCFDTDPYHRSVRNVASAGNSVELWGSHSIDEAFSMVFQAFRGGRIPRDEMV